MSVEEEQPMSPSSSPHVASPRRRVRAQRGLALACLTVVLALMPACYGAAGRAAARAEAAASPLTTAEAFVDLLAARQFDRAESYFDSTVRAALPAAALGNAWAALTAQAGAFQRRLSARVVQTGGYQSVYVTCAFARAAIDVVVTFDGDGQIGGLHFVQSTAAAPTPAPPHGRSGAFSERAVTIGTAPWRLPGTLTLPNGRGPFAAVVLVAGSGPEDRDETIGPNKPLRDLSWGLAAHGIAVLRFDKRTLVYGASLTPARLAALRFTVVQESVDDALAAVSLLRATPSIDPRRIFVLGHSLGGTVAPRIAARDRTLAGLVIMAGATTPLPDEIVRQYLYLRSIGQATQAQVEAIKAVVARIKALRPADVSSAELLLGATPAYWLDLRSYDPIATAKTLTCPLLILQGGRDYQVTVQEFQSWKAALSGRHNVAFRLYPDLNHLFMAGKGPGTPKEYAIAGHVDASVVSDIARWIGGIHPRG